MQRSLLRTKSVSALVAERSVGDSYLRRALGPLSLAVFGFGATFSSGAFILIGPVEAWHAGPAVLLSIAIAAVVSLLAALCYAEFASVLPLTGSAYTYSYAALGELPAYILAWISLLQSLATIATLSIGWSAYTLSFLARFSLRIPSQFAGAPLPRDLAAVTARPSTLFNLPAIVLILLMSAVLFQGARESTLVRGGLILPMKLAATALIIIAAAADFNPSSLEPFVPPNSGSFGAFGWSGVVTAAAVLFFLYLGAEAVSTSFEEARDPRKDITLAVAITIVTVSLLYMGLAACMTGAVDFHRLDSANALSRVLDAARVNVFLSAGLELVIVITITSTILLSLSALSRTLFALSVDGLLPPILSRVHSRFRTPYVAILACGLSAASLAGFSSLSRAAPLASISALVSFAFTSVAVLIGRKALPDVVRFRLPFAPLLSMLSCLSCVGLAAVLALHDLTVGAILVIWVGVGAIAYLFFGYKHSALSSVPEEEVVHPD